ncbi:hypothetical protein PanWU01x14_243820 [Parasponia andersonii]|uniref:Uncharacterized protein n=1 Tax=Parasponia andersonii TaxID=3476 RepID=A0A2P5BFG4_PARAD|nr:hypothetical protein PanWU01x14_243820 [Parasponia andersonii]
MKKTSSLRPHIDEDHIFNSNLGLERIKAFTSLHPPQSLTHSSSFSPPSLLGAIEARRLCFQSFSLVGMFLIDFYTFFSKAL